MQKPGQGLSQAAENGVSVRTFLIADVRGYTAFTEERGDEAAAVLAARFAELVREGVGAYGGEILGLRGDEASVSFSSARQALRAAVGLQQQFAREERQSGLPMKVGIGLDAGEAVPAEDGYRGGALNLAARLCSLASGSEVLASEAVIHLARTVEDLAYLDRGSVDLKGFQKLVPVVQVVARDKSEELTDRQRAELPEETEHAALPIGGFLGALPTGTLVARDEELAEILNAADRVAEGRGELVMLAGEAGAGKTRLAQELTVHVRNRGFFLAAGRCYENQQAVPYYPFFEAFDTLYSLAPSKLREAIPTRWPHLASLLPGHRLPKPPPSASAHEERQLLFFSVAGFLEALSAAKPIAFLVDDLHWADATSLLLLEHLARSTRSHRIFLLGTYRDTDVGRKDPLERMILDLSREKLIERVAIRRLGEAGTAELMSASMGDLAVSPALAALVHRHTEGNAFFTEEVLRALLDRGDVYPSNGTLASRPIEEIEVPESIRSAVGQRLARLSEPAQEVVEEASILGQTFRFEELEAMTGRPEAEIEEALEESCNVRLIKEGKEDYTFNHALTQQALYVELPVRRRQKLHLRAGEAIASLPEAERNRRAAELEWHFLEGRAPERALPFAMKVGDRAEAAFAHGEAAKHYEVALDLALELEDRRREAEAQEKLGSLYTATIQYDRALESLDEAARRYAELGDVESEARVVAQMGRAHFAAGSNEEGIDRVESILTDAGNKASISVQAALHSVLAHLYFARGDYSRSLALSERASALAKDAGGGGLLAEAEVRRGSNLPMLGRWREGAAVLQEGIQIAAQARDLFSQCRGLQFLAGVNLAQGRLGQAEEQLKEALDLARRMANQRQEAHCLVGISLITFIRGDSTEAAALSDRAVPLMETLKGFWLSMPKAAGLSLALSAAEWEAMPPSLRKAIELSEAGMSLPALRQSQIVAENELAAGHAEQALLRLRDISGDASEGEQIRGMQPLLARAELEAGNQAEAEEMAQTGIEAARAEDLRFRLIAWLRVLGAALAHQDRRQEAEPAFEEAAELAQEIPYPFAEASVLKDLEVVRAEGA